MHFIPKFHCEMNPIERVWGQAKRYTRAHTNFTIAGLRNIIQPGLDSVSVDLIRKYFRKAREYERAYREGHQAGMEVEMAYTNLIAAVCMRLNFYICFEVYALISLAIIILLG